MVEAGQRDKKVTIEYLPTTDEAGSSGFPVSDWTVLGTEYMSKREVSQTERFTGAQLSAPVDTEWEMPYRQTMDPDAIDVPARRRLVYRGRRYDITRASLMTFEDGQGIKLVTLARSGNES